MHPGNEPSKLEESRNRNLTMKQIFSDVIHSGIFSFSKYLGSTFKILALFVGPPSRAKNFSRSLVSVTKENNFFTAGW